MNVTVIIVEQLGWDAQLKTLTYSPKDQLDLWIATPDEYLDERRAPFHILDPEQEDEFALKFQRTRSRTSSRYTRLSDGTAQFETDWRGIPTKRTSLSCYALCLPQDAVPDLIEFSDPRIPGHLYRYRAIYDGQEGRVICYLNCRSKYGSFDFHLVVKFHLDSSACESFAPVSGGDYEPDLGDFEMMAAGRWTEHHSRN